MKPCRYCEKEFEPRRSWQKDCSKECHYQFWKRENRNRYRELKRLRDLPRTPEPSQSTVGKTEDLVGVG